LRKIRKENEISHRKQKKLGSPIAVNLRYRVAYSRGWPIIKVLQHFVRLMGLMTHNYWQFHGSAERATLSHATQINPLAFLPFPIAHLRLLPHLGAL